MAALENTRHEQFAQNIVKGMTQHQAYKEAFPNTATWKETSIDPKASELMKNPEVIERIKELNDAVASDAVLSRQERMMILTNIALDNAQHPKQRMTAIDLLNKMDGDYVKKVEATVRNDLSDTAAKIEAILDE